MDAVGENYALARCAQSKTRCLWEALAVNCPALKLIGLQADHHADGLFFRIGKLGRKNNLICGNDFYFTVFPHGNGLAQFSMPQQGLIDCLTQYALNLFGMFEKEPA
jgi:hypothetical protein